MRIVLALFAGALCGAVPAAAEPCRLCSPREQDASSDPVKALVLEVETSLDFGTLVLTGVGGGMARITPDGSRSSSGAVGTLSGRAMVGTVVIRGEPGRSIRVDLPNRINLLSTGGNRVTLEKVIADLGSHPRLDGRGELTFHFGGELVVGGTADGDYRGDVPIAAEYF